MNSVRCLFRVLSVSTTYDGAITARIAPTYSSRDGKSSEENRSFWEATPSGEGEVRIDADTPAAELFKAGGYVYLDIYQWRSLDDPPAPSPLHLRSDWQLEEVAIRLDHFRVKLCARLSPDAKGWQKGQPYDNGRGAAVFGSRCPHGSLEMQINNLHAWSFFAFTPAKNQAPFGYVIDFSAA